jgi:hypothetical protein
MIVVAIRASCMSFSSCVIEKEFEMVAENNEWLSSTFASEKLTGAVIGCRQLLGRPRLTKRT